MHTSITVEQAIGQRLMVAFEGKGDLSPEMRTAIREYHPAGVTLFETLNLDTSPAQIRALNAALQQAAAEAGLPPLLIAVDQEGGQLNAVLRGATLMPGNLALGAAGDANLARQMGQAIGRELAAMGINLNYAPVCDVNSNPKNHGASIRSFGEDPQSVGQLAAAVITGLQEAGVIATAKHFPGAGDSATDAHYALSVVPHSRQRLDEVELPPFRSAIDAGVKLIMTAHMALPAVDGRPDVPSTLSPVILKGLLRQELGYQQVIITDAMDMHAIRQGEGLGEDAVRAAAAGADLLLLTADPDDQRRVYTSLLQASGAGQLDWNDTLESVQRVLALKSWLAAQPPQPDLSVVGCAAHHALADEIARRSVTLVRDQVGLLPLRLESNQRMLVIMPAPVDLTPADTSSFITPTLAQALRAYHHPVDELIVPFTPTGQDISAAVEKARQYDKLVIGTMNAYTQPAQAALVKALLELGLPSVVAALRLPYDLAAFPQAPTYACTYSIHTHSMHALARALFGQAAFGGCLPVSIPGLYQRGYRKD